MSDQTVYTVPKDKQAIAVHLTPETTLDGEIFLEFAAEDLSIHQRITAFLENESPFFPFKISATQTMTFISKKNVRIIEVTFPEDPDTTYFANRFMYSFPIVAQFGDGETVTGELLAEVPQEKARLSDCLNLPDNFLNVKTPDKMFYINKTALQRVGYADKT